MQSGYTALVQQRSAWWIGWIEEVPGVNGQGRTREDLLDNLRFALAEAGTMYRVNALVGRSPAWYRISGPTASKDTWWIAESGNVQLVCWGRWHLRNSVWVGTVVVQATDVHMVMGPGHPDFGNQPPYPPTYPTQAP